jgi:hypothetical protein
MIQIVNKDSGEPLGTISEEELKVLVDHLEEENRQDTDYWVDAATIQLLEAGGASVHLLDVLRRAVGSHEGVELAWNKAA